MILYQYNPHNSILGKQNFNSHLFISQPSSQPESSKCSWGGRLFPEAILGPRQPPKTEEILAGPWNFVRSGIPTGTSRSAGPAQPASPPAHSSCKASIQQAWQASQQPAT